MEGEPVLFAEKERPPTEEMIEEQLGEKYVLWKTLLSDISLQYQGSEGTWNWYNDGKRWLYKMVYKKKTIFWGTVYPGYISITFYFGNKAEPVILNSELPQNVKDEFITAKRYGSLRAIQTKLTDQSGVELVNKIAAIKVKLK